MPFFKAATPGTLLVLAGTVLMVLVTLSAPIIKSIAFLEANFSGSGGGASLAGDVRLGTLGYCSGDQCITPTLGYELDPNELLGVASDFIDLPNNLIRWLTYVLVLHPVGAGLGLLSLLCGLLGHIREFSIVLSLTATWLASLAGTISLIAFVFDMVVFTLVKNRINDAAQSQGGVNVNTSASYGNAIWLTLAGFILFIMSGCCFKFGRRVARERKADRSEDKKPNLDPYYANQARLDAEKAEEERLAERGQYRNRQERGLPSFAENMDTSREEQIPLRSYEDTSGYADPYADQVPGVGVGYGRRNQPSRRSTGNTSEDQYHNNGYRTDHEAMPSHAESFNPNAYGQQGSQFMSGGYGPSTTPGPYLPTSTSFQRPTTPLQQGGTPYQSSATPYRPVDAAYQNTPYQQSTTPYQQSTTPYQPSSTPYQSSRTPYQQSSVPYQPSSTPAPYVPAPAPAAYAAYNQANDSPPRARTYGLGQGQQSYDPPNSTAPYQTGSRAIPYSDPTYDYEQPSYTNPQEQSYGNSSYQTAPQSMPNSYRNEHESYDNPPTSSAYGGMDDPSQDHENPYYRQGNQDTNLSRNGSIGTALPQYQSEADSHALPLPGANDQTQLGYGHSTETPMRGGRQRSLSPRGPRQMSSSFGQAAETNQYRY